MESSTAIPIPVTPLTRRWSVWSLWYCRAVQVRSARLRRSLSESLWCPIKNLSYGVVSVSLVFVSSVVSAVSPKDWKSECGLGTAASDVMSGALLVRGQHESMLVHVYSVCKHTVIIERDIHSVCASTHTMYITLNDCTFLSIHLA